MFDNVYSVHMETILVLAAQASILIVMAASIFGLPLIGLYCFFTRR